MKTNITLLSIFCFFAVPVIFSSCGGGPESLDETPTRGKKQIAVDESFQLLADTEIFTFQSLYPYTKITPQYLPEARVIDLLIEDSIKMVIVSRQLTEGETADLRARQIIARTTKVAYDAVGFILNKENPDSNIRYDQLQAIFDGRITNWSQIDKKSGLGDILVVFDHNNSGNFRFIKEKFLGDKAVPANCFAVNSNPEVLEYVKTKKNAIGVIGINWISDREDTISHRFLSGIRVAGIGVPGDSLGLGYFTKPYQGNIAEGSYPLSREVYVICTESFAGLGTGFASFIAGDVGQRIILKSGLVPATMPVRLMQVKKTL